MMYHSDYSKALSWFISNEWEIQKNIKGKKVELRLLYKKQFIKSKTVNYDTKLLEEVKNSIMAIYNHYSKQNEK